MGSDIELSALSAFAAIVAVAFYTMIDSTGSILGLDNEWNFALRCSPVACIFAAVEDCRCLAQLSSLVPSDRQKLDAWSARRRGDSVRATGAAGDGFATAHEQSKLRKLSVLVIFPQAIKILATQNTLWTKTMCGTYIASHAIRRLTIVVARRRGGDVQVSEIEQSQDLAIGAATQRNVLTQTGLIITIASMYALVALAIFCMEDLRSAPPLRTFASWLLLSLAWTPLSDIARAYANGLFETYDALIGIKGLMIDVGF